jgi:hypothetical protein
LHELLQREQAEAAASDYAQADTGIHSRRLCESRARANEYTRETLWFARGITNTASAAKIKKMT